MNSFSLTQPNEGVYSVTDDTNATYSFDIHPFDMCRTAPDEEIVSIIAQTAIERIEMKGTSLPEPQYLLGECHKNSVALGTNLYQNGYRPTLVSGCNLGAGDANSLPEAYKQKSVHHWIELNGLTLEICSEANGCTGHLYYSSYSPSNYKALRKISISEYMQSDIEYPTSENQEKFIELTTIY